jgi:hypothetical protein
MALSFGIGLWRAMTQEDDVMAVLQHIANEAGGSFRDIVGSRVVEFHPHGRKRTTRTMDEAESARIIGQVERCASETTYDLFPTCLEVAPIYLPAQPRKRRISLPDTRFDSIPLGSILNALREVHKRSSGDEDWLNLRSLLIRQLETSYSQKFPFVVYGFG